MSRYLGIDTSAYTSSVAVYNSSNGEICERRRLLQVKPGRRGLRQSEAFYQHVNALPGLLADLDQEMSLPELCAVGVSAWPRRKHESYMPVFRAGMATARVASLMRQIPLYTFSHQEGHIFSGLYEYPEILLDTPFMAVHFSGGTSEILSVDRDPGLPIRVQILASSGDLNVGQLIDRVGVRLGLNFPAGPALEEMARLAGSCGQNPGGIKIPVRDGNISFSGAETRAYQLLDEGMAPAELAFLLLISIADALALALQESARRIKVRKVLLAGGVMANSIIRERLAVSMAREMPEMKLFFTSPRYSGDNAAGTAYLTYLVNAGFLPPGEAPAKGMGLFEI